MKSKASSTFKLVLSVCVNDGGSGGGGLMGVHAEGGTKLAENI